MDRRILTITTVLALTSLAALAAGTRTRWSDRVLGPPHVLTASA
jgi:hypothetical protein